MCVCETQKEREGKEYKTEIKRNNNNNEKK